jgi:uncharacterized membrane protein
MFDVLLLVATITTGLISGLFFGFSFCVMIALRQVDDRVFFDVMQRINREIQNPLFGLIFMAALLGSAAVLVIDLTNGDGIDLRAVGGAAMYLVSMLITMGINIPLNNKLESAGPVARAKDITGARKAFEGPWTLWNHIRWLFGTAGFVFLLLAAVQS